MREGRKKERERESERGQMKSKNASPQTKSAFCCSIERKPLKHPLCSDVLLSFLYAIAKEERKNERKRLFVFVYLPL
jgi:hypothetical protein